MSNVVKKVKKQAGGIRVFFIFYLGITKQEAVVVKPTKWKFMAIIARIAKL